MLRLSADEVLDYQERNFAQGQTWDLVFATAGNRSFGDVQRVPTAQGVMVSTQLSPRLALKVVTVRLKRGPQLRFVPARERSVDLAFLARLVETGELPVPVDRTLALANCPRRTATSRRAGCAARWTCGSSKGLGRDDVRLLGQIGLSFGGRPTVRKQKRSAVSGALIL